MKAHFTENSNEKGKDLPKTRNFGLNATAKPRFVVMTSRFCIKEDFTSKI